MNGRRDSRKVTKVAGALDVVAWDNDWLNGVYGELRGEGLRLRLKKNRQELVGGLWHKPWLRLLQKLERWPNKPMHRSARRTVLIILRLPFARPVMGSVRHP